MKRLVPIIALLAGGLIYPQSQNDPDVTNIITSANSLQAKINALQAQAQASNDAIAFYNRLKAICPTCIDAINSVISGQTLNLSGVIICCGPTTIPPTPQGSDLIYIYPTPAAAAAKP